MQFTVVTTEAVAMWVCFDRKFILMDSAIYIKYHLSTTLVVVEMASVKTGSFNEGSSSSSY